jgi:hypothetical protein
VTDWRDFEFFGALAKPKPLMELRLFKLRPENCCETRAICYRHGPYGHPEEKRIFPSSS